MNRSASGGGGFTLVELLVSLAIVGMMSLLLAQGLQGGRRIWERVETRSRAGDSVLAAQLRLDQLIARAVPQTSFQGSHPFSRFEGTPTGLTLLGDPGEGAAGGVQLLSLALGADGRLVLGRRPDLVPRAGPPLPQVEATLIAGVDRIELGYFGAAPPDNERRWRTSWLDQPSLPELVRLRLAFAAGDRRRWPELIVRPAATVDTACVFAPSTGRCKGRS